MDPLPTEPSPLPSPGRGPRQGLPRLAPAGRLGDGFPLRPGIVAACLLLGSPAPRAAAQPTTLFADGEFADWATVPGLADWEVTGGRQPSGGNPGAHYRLTHVHRAADPFAPNITSYSTYQGASFPPPPAAAEDLFELRLDVAGEDLAPGTSPPQLFWGAALVQGGRTFRSIDSSTPAFPPSFLSDRVLVRADRFRAVDGAAPLTPDFSPGAPPLQVGFYVQTTAVTGAQGPRTIRVRVDGFRMRFLGPPPEGISFSVGDGGHLWGDDPLIPYEITIENTGPPETDVVLTEIVPANTRFVPQASTGGWSCDPGPDEGSLCTLPLGDLPTGASRSAVFAVRVRQGTPEGFEILTEAGFGTAAAAAEGGVGARGHGTCTVTWTEFPGEPCLVATYPDPSAPAPPHPTRCVTRTFTPGSLACCVLAFFGVDCQTRCVTACNAPCEQILIIPW